MESTLTKVHFSGLNLLCSLEKHTDHIQYNFEREKNVVEFQIKQPYIHMIRIFFFSTTLNS